MGGLGYQADGLWAGISAIDGCGLGYQADRGGRQWEGELKATLRRRPNTASHHPFTHRLSLRPIPQAAVERLRSELARRLAADGTQAPHLCSVTLDWWLWEEGERNIERHRPHHRTLTICY